MRNGAMREMVSENKVLTAEQYAALPDNGTKSELVSGVVVEIPFSPYAHGLITVELIYHIDGYVDQSEVGIVTSGSGYITARNPDSVRGPDIAFITKARLGNVDPNGYVPVAPDLAVEVIAPSDFEQALRLKVIEYFRAGTRLMWVVYPNTKQVYVYDGSSTNIKVVDINGTLNGGEVLPGFTLPLAELFRGLGE